jgi:hypothetical protein
MGCYKKIPFYKLNFEADMSWLLEINLQNYMSVSLETRKRLGHLLSLYEVENYDKKNITYCNWCDKIHLLIEKELFYRQEEHLEKDTYLFIKHLFLKDKRYYKYKELDKEIREFIFFKSQSLPIKSIEP